VPLQHGHGILVNLNLPGDLKTGLLKALTESFNACEQ
jgi:hypothetical protein